MQTKKRADNIHPYILLRLNIHNSDLIFPGLGRGLVLRLILLCNGAPSRRALRNGHA